MIKYREVAECDKIQAGILPVGLLQFYETILSLYIEMDREFTPPPDYFPSGQVSPLPPKCFIPAMTWYEGINNDPDEIKTDGRTIGSAEINFNDGKWHCILYEERSYNIDKQLIYDKLDDLIYDQLRKFMLLRAEAILQHDPEIRKKYNDLLVTKENKTTFYQYKRPYVYRLVNKMMHAVKPEWESRLQEKADDNGIEI